VNRKFKKGREEANNSRRKLSEFEAEAFRCDIKFGRNEINLSNRLGKFTECPGKSTLDLEFWIIELKLLLLRSECAFG
jgi:hypothetical protein